VPASYYGRIAHLFVQKGAHLWGTFNEMSNELQLHDGDGDGGESLIDNAVVRTLMTGGDVYIVDKDDMPADAPLAAVFRY
jgi:hypothetical protein